jgi:hypothetical protein
MEFSLPCYALQKQKSLGQWPVLMMLLPPVSFGQWLYTALSLLCHDPHNQKSMDQWAFLMLHGLSVSFADGLAPLALLHLKSSEVHRFASLLLFLQLRGSWTQKD